MYTLQVFVLLYWFWDEDRKLVNRYVCVGKSIAEVISKKSTALEVLNLGSKNDPMYRTYLPGQPVPEVEDGHHGRPEFFQILEQEVELTIDVLINHQPVKL